MRSPNRSRSRKLDDSKVASAACWPTPRPWFDEPPHPGEDAPNVVVILLDDIGFAHFGCYGSTIDTPNIDRLAAGGLQYTNFHVTPLCSPTARVAAHRAQPPRGRHAVGVELQHRLPASARPHLRPRGDDRRGACATRATRRSAPASGTSRRWSSARRPARTTSGRWHAASTASTASSRARPTSSTPTSCATTTRSTRRPVPTDGYHLSEDLVDQLMRMISDSKGVRPDRPFFVYLAVRRHARAAPGAGRRTSRSTAGEFDEGWDVVRERWFERQLELGVMPARTPSWRRATPASSRGTRCPRTSSGSRRACRRRSPRSSTTPTPRSVASSTASRDIGRARQHDARSCCPTTAPRQEGGPFGVHARDEVLQRHPRDARRGDRPHRRHRRPAQPHQLPVGLGAGRQHAVQVVQAEHPRGRRARAADRALAGGHRRRSAAALRHQFHPRHRRRADDLRGRSASRRPTCTDGLEQMPVTGTLVRRRRSPTRRAGHEARCSTSR